MKRANEVIGKLKRGIRRIPLVGDIAARCRRALEPLPPKEVELRFMRLDVLDADSTVGRQRKKILNVLNYTKNSGSAYSASEYSAAYHTVKIGGEVIRGQRNPAERLEVLPLDFSGKSVLDIGCNQGGMLFELSRSIHCGVGIDYDSRMINAANRMKAFQEVDNCHFYVFDLDREPFDIIRDFLPEENVDIVFLLSVCRWIRKWREVISFCAAISNLMLFESNGTDEEQYAQIDHLRRVYRRVDRIREVSADDPVWKDRQLFFCSEPRLNNAISCGTDV